MITTKVFQSGNSQAVRIPKEYRIDADEITVNRIGKALVLLPKDDSWSLFSEGVQEIGEDYPSTIEGNKPQKRSDIK
ncbi:MAG: type II toxin-antitoxin system VapB family antitoxin [Kiritimatiellae bacterium]|nr:type II toxin-antitoxin system VapB family antitoxin [Kiritimatiellia bacterium]